MIYLIAIAVELLFFIGLVIYGMLKIVAITDEIAEKNND